VYLLVCNIFFKHICLHICIVFAIHLFTYMPIYIQHTNYARAHSCILCIETSSNKYLQHPNNPRTNTYYARAHSCILCIEKCTHSRTPSTDIGWRKSIGCLKLQVNFCKRATNYRALLRKMTYKDKASYASTLPCTCISSIHLRYFQICITYIRYFQICIL